MYYPEVTWGPIMANVFKYTGAFTYILGEDTKAFGTTITFPSSGF